MYTSKTPSMATKTSMILGWVVGLVCGILVAVAAFHVVDAFVSSDASGTAQTVLPAVGLETGDLRAMDRADAIAANAQAGDVSAEVAPALDVANARSQDVADTITANTATDATLSGARATDMADAIEANRNNAVVVNNTEKGLGTSKTRH